MARKKRIEHHELMAETEKLLLEKGYNAFHFRLLSERLGVGRSTIYEYYANKDELIIAYIHIFAFERVEDCKKIMKISDIKEKIREFLRIFLKYSHVQQVITMLTQMEEQSKDAERVKPVRELSRQIYLYSLEIIKEAKQTGLLRKEVDNTFISYIMFNLIQIPNLRKQSEEERLNEMIDFILNGVGA
ncbi:TetR/AcrR family transcriptional regulator [Bacillus massiliigorillae]|uniref:TetR/AcrR family transcriptional regulator n=1 Tax=Bacillus massiliigorillae TaxID=1243664 RepID=UPI0003A78A62|nr:TetR/AcrR family transcriptional regulator [Bacillus massiliigorillae]